MKNEPMVKTLNKKKKKNHDNISPSIQSLVIDINSVIPDPDNPRSHPPESISAIADSLKTYGQQKPIVIDDEGICLAGNGTLQAARELGWKYIAASRSSLKGNRAKAFSVADNKSQEVSFWDEDKLASILIELEADDKTNLPTGFSDAEISEWINLADKKITPEDSRGSITLKLKNKIRIVLSIDDIEIFEKAIRATNLKNRGAAIVAICREYIGKTSLDYVLLENEKV